MSTQCRREFDQNLMKFCPFRMIYRPKFRSRCDLSHSTLRIWLSQPINSKNHQNICVYWIPNDIFWRNFGQKLVKFCPFGVIYRPKFRSRCDLRHCTLRIRLSHWIHTKNHQNIRVDWIPNPYFATKEWNFGRLGWFLDQNLGLGVIYRTVPSESQDLQQFTPKKRRNVRVILVRRAEFWFNRSAHSASLHLAGVEAGRLGGLILVF